MTAQIMDGKKMAEGLKQNIRRWMSAIPPEKGRPGLAVIMVGESAASQSYIRGKEKDCKECGFYSAMYTLPSDASEKDILDLIDVLNDDPNIHGILLQLPLPKGLDSQKIIARINPQKDVDGIHPVNAGLLLSGKPQLVPCTPAGVLKLLDLYHIPLEGKKCAVIGRSNIVGKPLALLLLGRNATVTICHSKTANLAEETRRADIVVTAAGSPGLIRADMIQDGTVVVDVSVNRGADGKLCGDADFDTVSQRASWITPVPGGTGPMTRVMLLSNTLKAFCFLSGLQEPDTI